MRLIFKSSELDLAQIGFKGMNMNDVASKEINDSLNRSINKIERDKTRPNKISASAFLNNSKQVNK